MRNLTKESFLSALPLVLQEDANLYALAEAIAEKLEEHGLETDLAMLYPAIDSLPDAVLDILADDYKVDWYNYDYPTEAKRNLVKTHWYVHRYMGTAGAVRKAIRAVYPQSDVEEWWQDCYEGGEPYHFRIMLEASAPIVPVTNTDILREVELYKSFRSHLDGVVYRSTIGIVVENGRGWQDYYGRLCGTYPTRRVHGGWEHGEIVVETCAESIRHGIPPSGKLLTGTWPARATPGGKSNEGVTVETDSLGVIYHDPETGILRSGMLVHGGAPGGHRSDGIVVDLTGNGQAYQNPATGEIPTGTFPETAVSGTHPSGALDAASEGLGFSYTGPRCGATPFIPT